MKIFHLGCKVDTNIPISELKYKIQIYDTVKKKYMPYLNSLQPVLSSKEVYVAFNFPIDLSEEQAAKYKVFIYLYRKYQASSPTLVDYSTQVLGYFYKADNYKKLKPLKAIQSSGDTSGKQPGNSPPTDILNISRKQIFVTPEYPAGHQNDPFKKDRIEQELRDRLAAGRQSQGEGYPNQKRSSLCGPVAYFYCLLKDRPDLYQIAVKQLWETGKANFANLEIKAGDAAQPKNFFDEAGDQRISGLDWITLGSLRDSENLIWDYDSPTKEMAAITTHWDMEKWLTKSDAKDLRNLVTIRGSSTLKELAEINKYAIQGYRVVQLMSSRNIFQGATTPNLKTHWIVWESPLVSQSTGLNIDENSNLTDLVDLKLFTWGWVGKLTQFGDIQHTSTITLKKFLEASFGAIVFKSL